MLDQILFSYSDAAGKITHRVSCRLLRPLDELRADYALLSNAVLDEHILSMCVEPLEDDAFSGPFAEVYHVGEDGDVPGKVHRFLTTLGLNPSPA